MDVCAALRDEAASVMADQPVLFAYLFGSHARGDARVGSDVDVAAYLSDEATPAAHLALSLDLAGRLAHRSGLGPIDGVVVVNDAPLRLVGRILAHRCVIYSRDEPARVAYEVRMRARALDFEPRARALVPWTSSHAPARSCPGLRATRMRARALDFEPRARALDRQLLAHMAQSER